MSVLKLMNFNIGGTGVLQSQENLPGTRNGDSVTVQVMFAKLRCNKFKLIDLYNLCVN